MKFEILTPDPLHILSSTIKVVENLAHITIHEDKLDHTANKVQKRLAAGLDSAEANFGSTGTYEEDVQLIFLEDVVNFCFWTKPGRPEWQVSHPAGEIPGDGWYSLVNCFQRARANHLPILDAAFLAALSFAQVREIFKGEGGIDIPLTEKRLHNLQEAGHVLQSKYSGKFVNALESTHYDAVELVKCLYTNFSSFQDITPYAGQEIFFLKRAQICVQDLSYITQKYNNRPIANRNALTAFADYKLPQMLREYGAIEYTGGLAEKVDNYTLITAASREEIEIRAVTIWCVELIRQKLESYTAADIDNALWLLSQSEPAHKPHHRTETVFY